METIIKAWGMITNSPGIQGRSRLNREIVVEAGVPKIRQSLPNFEQDTGGVRYRNIFPQSQF